MKSQRMVACAYKIRWSIDRRGSPKTPMPKVVVQTIVIAQMNVAAAVKEMAGAGPRSRQSAGTGRLWPGQESTFDSGIRIRDEHKAGDHRERKHSFRDFAP